VWGAIKRGIKKAANAVSKAVNKAADAVADAVATVGNAIGDALSWLGGKIPDGGFFGWLGDVISGVFTFVAGIVKAVGAILGGVLSGLIKIVGGILTLDLDGILEGLGDLASGIAGGLIAILGTAVALIQVIFTVGRPRKLNARERELIELVFRESVATYNVRVVDGGAGLFSINSRPFVLGDTIYMKGNDATNQPSTFVHECVHVWQNQHAGSRYTAEALAGQWWGDNYNWQKEAAEGRSWDRFQREPQGEFIEDVYDNGQVQRGSSGNGAFFDEDDESMRLFMDGPTDRTALANAATTMIRDATPWRLSGLG
jgi:hypothetical protein